MVKFEKSIKKFINDYSVIIIIIVAIVLFYFLNNYNNKKLVTFENLSTKNDRKFDNVNGVNSSNIKGVGSDLDNEQHMKISGIKTNMGGIKPKDCNVEKMINPSQLLPKDNNKFFNNMNPNGNGDLKNMNLITGTEKIGMSSQVLRNANLQLRCEPANPRNKVGPWMQTTIEPDLHRRPLDGSCK